MLRRGAGSSLRHIPVALPSTGLLQTQVRSVWFGKKESAFSKDLPFAKKIDRDPKNTSIKNLHKKQYMTDADFDPISLGFYLEGVDGEFKDEVRDYLRKNPNTYLYDAGSGQVTDPLQEHTHVVTKLRHLARRNFITLVQANTRPRGIASFLEVVATLDVNMALAALHQYLMFGSILHQFGEAHHHNWVNMDKVDTMETVGCFAGGEVGSETAPYVTTAQFVTRTRQITLDSVHSLGNKYGIVNAASAKWALVTAELSSGETLKAPQLFLVRVRDDNGQLCPGVHFQSIGNTHGLNGSGIGLFRFEKLAVDPRALIPTTHRINEEGVLTPMTKPVDALSALAKLYRLGSLSIGIGKAKRLGTDLVSYLTTRMCVGGTHNHDYPLLGFHRNQDQFGKAFSSLICLAQLQMHCTAPFFDHPNKERTEEDHVRLVLVHMHTLKLCEDLSRLSSDLMGHHHYVQANGTLQASALSSYCYAIEGWDREHLVRQLAEVIVDSSLGVKRAPLAMRIAAKLPAFLAPVKMVCASPLFREDEDSSTNFFQCMQSFRLVDGKKKMKARMIKERSFGPDETFFYVHNYYYKESRAVVDAYWYQYLTTALHEMAQTSREVENKSQLEVVSRHYSMAHGEDSLLWLVKHGWCSTRWLWMMEMRKVTHTNHITVQAVHYSKLFKIPEEFKRSPISSSVADAYALGAVPIVPPPEKRDPNKFYHGAFIPDHLFEEGD